MNGKEKDPKPKKGVDPEELEDPTLWTILKIIKNALGTLKDKTAIILASSFLLLILWGAEGDLKIFSNIFGQDWLKTLLPGIPWRDQLATFVGGFILLVVVPCCIIKFVFKERLSEYGLGWPKEGRKLGVLTFFVVLPIALILMYFGSFNPEIQAEYPLFKDAGGVFTIAKGDWGSFIVYELVYLLFFFVIEFIYRGYLLFGLFKIKDIDALKGIKGIKGPLVFGMYAILIQMLSYTMWHIAKPTPELVVSIVWGVAIGAVVLKIRSIWPIIIVHWLYNVFLDTLLWLR